MAHYFGVARAEAPAEVLDASTFAELYDRRLAVPVTLAFTREEFKRRVDAWQDAELMGEKEEAKRLKAAVFEIKNTAAILPGIYNADRCPRVTENIVKVHLIMIDVDDHDDAMRLWEGREKLLDSALPPVNFAMYTTISSTPTLMRVRLVLDAEPFDPADYAKAVGWACDALGIAASPESKVPNQLMFRPARFADTESSPVFAYRKSSSIRLTPAMFAGYTVEDGDRVYGCDLDGLSLPIQGVDLETVEDMLKSVSPDCDRDTWVRIAMAMKHQFSTAEDAAKEAYDVFHIWSAEGSTYESDKECWGVWKSIRNHSFVTRPVTLRTLIKLAKESGWVQDAAEDKHYQQLKQRIAEATSPTAVRATLPGVFDHPLLGPINQDSIATLVADKLTKLGQPTKVSAVKAEIKAREKEIKEERKSAPAAAAPAWCQDVVYASGINKFVNLSSFLPRAPEAFNREHTGACHSAGIQIPADIYALQHVGIPVVYDAGYAPDKPDEVTFAKDGEYWYNSYRASYAPEDRSKANVAGERLLRHLHILTGEENATWLLSWMAWVVQNPGKKMCWSPVILGAEGTGKGFLGELMKAVIGRTNAKIVSNAMLTSGYTEWVGESQVLVFNEVRLKGEKGNAAYEIVKMIITDPIIPVTTKFKSARQVENIVSSMFITNHEDGIPITEGSRRFLCIKVKPSQISAVTGAEGSDYFDRLFELTGPLAGGARAFLLDWKDYPKGWNPLGNAPENEDKHIVARAAESDLRAAIRSVIECNESPLVQPDMLSFSVLAESLRQSEHAVGYNVAARRVTNELSSLGYRKTGRYRVGEIQHTIWVSADFTSDVAREIELRMNTI